MRSRPASSRGIDFGLRGLNRLSCCHSSLAPGPSGLRSAGRMHEALTFIDYSTYLDRDLLVAGNGDGATHTDKSLDMRLDGGRRVVRKR